MSPGIEDGESPPEPERFFGIRADWIFAGVVAVPFLVAAVLIGEGVWAAARDYWLLHHGRPGVGTVVAPRDLYSIETVRQRDPHTRLTREREVRHNWTDFRIMVDAENGGPVVIPYKVGGHHSRDLDGQTISMRIHPTDPGASRPTAALETWWQKPLAAGALALLPLFFGWVLGDAVYGWRRSWFGLPGAVAMDPTPEPPEAAEAPGAVAKPKAETEAEAGADPEVAAPAEAEPEPETEPEPDPDRKPPPVPRRRYGRGRGGSR